MGYVSASGLGPTSTWWAHPRWVQIRTTKGKNRGPRTKACENQEARPRRWDTHLVALAAAMPSSLLSTAAYPGTACTPRRLHSSLFLLVPFVRFASASLCCTSSSVVRPLLLGSSSSIRFMNDSSYASFVFCLRNLPSSMFRSSGTMT